MPEIIEVGQQNSIKNNKSLNFLNFYYICPSYIQDIYFMFPLDCFIARFFNKLRAFFYLK